MESSPTTSIEAIVEAATVYPGHRNLDSGEATTVYRTSFHIVADCRLAFPDVTIQDIDKPLDRFCKRNKLDFDEYFVCCDLMLLQDERAVRPIMDARTKLRIDPWRVALPPGVPDKQVYKDLLTAIYYVSRNTDPAGTFFLGCREAGLLIGKSHETARTMMLTFELRDCIAKTKTGKFRNGSSQYLYLLDCELSDAEIKNLTQESQESQDTHHHQSVELESDPIPETITPQAQGLVVDVATLPGMEEQTKPTGNLGTSEDMIAMSVNPKPGPLAILPIQTEVPDEPQPQTTLKKKEQTVTRPSSKRTGETVKAGDGLQAALARLGDIVNARTPEEEAEGLRKREEHIRGIETPATKPKGRLYKALSKIKQDCKAEGVSGAEKTKRQAAALARHLGDKSARTNKLMLDLINQHGIKMVHDEAVKVLADPTVRSAVGALNHRLKVAAEEAA